VRLARYALSVAVLSPLALSVGCDAHDDGYTTADPRILPKLPAGLTMHVLSKVETRDCEGPYCEVHAIVSGAPQDGSAPFSALEQSFLGQGWQPRPANGSGFVLMCKGGYNVAFAAPVDYVRTGPADVSKRITEWDPVAVIDLLPLSCG
jgi:hypothetical protein